jgi:uncharacterized protein
VTDLAIARSRAVDGASLEARVAALHDRLAACGSVIVAFSGGADSAFLAWTASRVLGDRALAVTAESPSYPARHRQVAIEVARRFGLRHEFIHTSELDRPEYRANPVNRCYYCKHELYSRLVAIARARGFAIVVDGSNADDRHDHRPGRQAAREFGVASPLDDANLTKAEIRELSRAGGLPTWDLPASACLSSRVPYNQEITPAKLQMIDAAEEALAGFGFRVFRVRHHDTLARVELGADEMGRALDPDVRESLVQRLKAIGYTHVALDLQGYRQGSLNEPIPLRPV